jgi:hypothetical protein
VAWSSIGQAVGVASRVIDAVARTFGTLLPEPIVKDVDLSTLSFSPLQLGVRVCPGWRAAQQDGSQAGPQQHVSGNTEARPTGRGGWYAESAALQEQAKADDPGRGSGVRRNQIDPGR